MEETRPSGGLRACLVAPHQFVLDEFARVLVEADIEVTRHQIAFSLAPCLVCECPRERRVWVVDGCLPPHTTEMLAAGCLEGETSGRVMVVAEELTEALVFPLLRAGVRGFMPYADARERLPEALRVMADGGSWIPRGVLTSFIDVVLARTPPSRFVPTWLALSRREREVLRLVLDSLSNKEIGCRLNISERTVKFHVSNLLSKFQAERRADLIRQALPMAPQVSWSA
jgi:DNA-binding NarL/FixJ family response regulator